ncbi:HNH endonuclease [Escherichia coli]|nr:HNH endonuclease [Escherichia coli]
MDIMFVMGLNGSQLDSKCRLENQDGLYGLFLESWGQKNNPQYNEALKTIIYRMQVKKIKKLDAFIASEPLLKNMPSKDERRLSNSDDGYFHINQVNAEKLRLELCRKQKFFSAYAKKEKPIENGTKRIFLHAEELQSQNDWKEIVFGEDSCNFGLTDNLEILSNRAFKLLNKKLIKPVGVAKPSKSTTKVDVYLRCPDVVSYILKISNGVCENCSKLGPFTNSLGIPYLEVHHVIPLSKGGADTPENCVALYPNCHKALHYAENINQITEFLYKKCNRLQK